MTRFKVRAQGLCTRRAQVALQTRGATSRKAPGGGPPPVTPVRTPPEDLQAPPRSCEEQAAGGGFRRATAPVLEGAAGDLQALP
eukprot:6548308-Alexandrium_andersonii.AAC.1